MSSADIVNTLYRQVLGRAPDPAGLAVDIAALDRGETPAQLQAALAISFEAQRDLSTAYSTVLNRPIDPAGQAGATAALAAGASLAQIQTAIASSPESQADRAALYQNELGRSPDANGLIYYEQVLANGGSLSNLQRFFATSDEAQQDIANLYQYGLGRAPDAAGLAASTQFLANGGSLAVVKAGILGSPEQVNDIATGYQAALGHGPTASELAGYESELASGQVFRHVQAELSELGSNQPSYFTEGYGKINPQTVGTGAAASFVYGLGNNDTLISATNFATVAEGAPYAPVGGSSPVPTTVITAFNTADDILQIQSSQNSSYASLKLTSVTIPGQASGLGTYDPGPTQATDVGLGDGSHILLIGFGPSAIPRANFHFV